MTTTLEALPRVDLLGVKFHAIDERQCVLHIAEELSAGRGGWAITPNLDILRQCQRDGGLRKMLETAELVVADGMPLIWASRLKGTPLPGRVAGSNLISSLSAEAARRGRSIYLLGGSPGSAVKAAGILTARFPGLRIAGTSCPTPGFEKTEGGISEVVGDLTAARPDIIFVGLGSPKTEHLITAIRTCLSGAWWVGIGISFSFLTGEVKRAPAWVQKAGLEWMHRLVQEPRRLAKRYLVHGIPFAVRLLASSALERRRSGRSGGPSET